MEQWIQFFKTRFSFILTLIIVCLFFMASGARAAAPIINGSAPLYTQQSNISISWNLSGEWYYSKSSYTYATCVFGSSNQTSTVFYGSEGKSNFKASFNLIEGTNTISIYAYNGGEMNSKTYLVTFDAVKPVVAITPPASPTSNKQPTWTWMLNNTIQSGIARYQFRFQSSDSWIDNSPLTAEIYTPSSPLPNGSYTLHIRAISNSGIIGDETIAEPIVITDTTIPILNEIKVDPAESVTNHQPQWSWSASPDVVRFKISLTKDGAPYLIDAAYSGTTYQTTLNDGTYQLTVIAVNASGYESPAMRSVVITVDTAPPTAPRIVSSLVCNESNYILIWEGGEDGGDNFDKYVINKYDIAGNMIAESHQTIEKSYPVVLPPGTTRFEVVAYDKAGNYNTSGQFDVIADMIKPAALDIKSPHYSNSRNYQLFWSGGTDENFDHYELKINGITASSYQENHQFDDLVLNPGTNTVEVIAYDKAMNYTSSGEYTVIVDTDVPQPPSISSSNYSNSANYILRWSGGNDDANFAEYQVYLNSGTIPVYRGTDQSYAVTLTQMTTSFEIIVYDQAGNQNSSGLFIVTLDNNTPLIPRIISSHYSNATNYILAWEDNGNASDLDHYELYIDTNTTPSYSGSNKSYPVTLSKTITTFRIDAYDKTNKLSSSGSFDVILDTQAPLVSFKPSDSSAVNVTSAATIIINIRDDGSGINPDSIAMRFDGKTVIPVKAVKGANECILYYVNTGPYVKQHTVQVTVKDLADNERTAAATFQVDNYRLGFGFGRLRF